MRKRLAFLASLVAVLLFGVGIAWASIPDSSGVIHGCRKTANPGAGALIVIDTDAGQTCPSGFTALDWNQTGPVGPPGQPGAGGLSGYQVLTQHVDLLPNPLPQGTSMGAPGGKKILSGGFYFDNGSGNPVPQLAYSFTDLAGTTHTWGFVCQSPMPCPIDKYIVVADSS